MINATSARGDLASLSTTSTIESGWWISATSSDTAEPAELLIEATSVGGSLDDWRSGVFSVAASALPLLCGIRSGCESYGREIAAGSTPQMIASLRSIIRNRPSKSIAVHISPKMKGARKPKREYKAPPTGGPRTSL